MQFASNGYVIQGDAIHLVGSVGDPTHSIIRVGDGNTAGAGYTATINSVLDGSTTLVKTDAGTLVLAGDNIYTGGTTVNGGVLQIGNGGTSGSIVGDVTNNASLIFNRSDVTTFNGVVSGTGSLAQAGGGTLILIGNNTYTGDTSISGGTLQIGDGGTSGSLLGNVTDDTSLVFNRSDSAAYGGVISGSGSLTQTGAGKLTLLGENSFTGGTTISQGTLELGNGATAGSIIGNVLNNGSLIFNTSSNSTYTSVVSGTGSLTKLGEGTLVLTGSNTFTGGTTVNSDTLEIASGTLGTGPVSVTYSGNKLPTFRVDNNVLLANQVIVTGGTLDNSGALVDAVDDSPVSGINGGFATIINRDGGSIVGKVAGVSMPSYSTIKNSSGSMIQGGTAGVILGFDGEVDNDGAGSLISSPNGFGIQTTRGGTIKNTGGATIAGATGIYLHDGGVIDNEAGSTIQSTNAAGGCQSTGGCAIYVNPSATAVGNFLQLTNAGTIVGDVRMDPTGINDVTLLPGGSIHGNLFVGTQGRMTLDGDAGTVQMYSQAVTGTTTVQGFTKFGNGTWIIDNDALTSLAGITVQSGTLQVGNGGTEGSLGNDPISVYGTLVFDRSDDTTMLGPMSGQGTMVKLGAGTLIVDSILPNVVINSGTLQLGDGGASVSGSYGTITNNASLVVDHSNDVSISAQISGPGSLLQEGSGTLFLSGGPNSYSGGTTISSGAIRTGNILPGNVTVNAGAVLDGYLNVSLAYQGLPGVGGNLSNAGEVKVYAGDSMVSGNYTQASTGTLAVSLGSKLAVTGTATLNGGTLEITGADSGYVSNTHTNVLTATGGLNGTFTSLVKDTGVVFTATSINYDANNV